MIELIELKETPRGPEIWVAGVYVRGWVGQQYNDKAYAMFMELTAALEKKSIRADQVLVMNDVIPFSHLALGGKFIYIPSIKGHEQVYVKLSNDRIAEWDEKMLTAHWTGQGIHSLNETGSDIDVQVIR